MHLSNENLLVIAVVGIVAGWLAGVVMRGGGYGMIGDIIVGIVGAFLGGFLFSLLGGTGVTGFNLWSLLVAFVGACILIFGWRLIRGRR